MVHISIRQREISLCVNVKLNWRLKDANSSKVVLASSRYPPSLHLLDLLSVAMNINPTSCKEKAKQMHLIRIFIQSAEACMNKYN